MQIVEINKINALGIEFKEPLHFEYKIDDKWHIMYNKELNVVGVGETFQECMEDAQFELAMLWQQIVDEDDSKLDESAIKTKKYLLSLKKS